MAKSIYLRTVYQCDRDRDSGSAKSGRQCTEKKNGLITDAMVLTGSMLEMVPSIRFGHTGAG